MRSTGPDRQAFLRAIQDSFPDITWENARFYDNGWDHAVVILDDTLVFRTPKNSEYVDEFAGEIGLLDYLSTKLAVAMPRYKLVSPDSRIAGYRIVPGSGLIDAGFQRLAGPERESVAKQLAEFLTVLHSTPKEILEKYGVRTGDQEADYVELSENCKTLLFPRLTSEESDTVLAFLDELRSSLNDRYEDVLAHWDLSCEHILWDADRQQVGIIDFSDRAVGDPAIDFAGLLECGPDFTKRVFDLYGGKKDDRLLARASLYFKRFPVSIMIDSMQGFPCTFEEGYEMFKERFQ